MAEGWQQLIADLRAALGLPPPKTKAPPEAAESLGADGKGEAVQSAAPDAAQPAAQSTVGQVANLSYNGQPLTPAETEVAVVTLAPAPALDSAGQPLPPAETETPTEAAPPPTLLQKLYSYAGLVATLLVAVGIGWYAYFGGPRPPAPDVVATFDGGEITIQQLRDHLAQLLPGWEGHSLTPEVYRAAVSHIVLNDRVRRWAAEQKADTESRFTDAMRHVSESLTLEEWVAELHQGEMTSAVREIDIQKYYEENRPNFGNATLSEVREQIKQTLAHQNQEQFFTDYIARLRAEATITRAYELLETPPPTDAQIRDYYAANRQQFTIPQRAIVDQIYVGVRDTGDEAEAAGRAKAAEALAALKIGKDVAGVAAAYSEVPYVAEGVTLEAEKNDQAVVEQAFALSTPGELSPVFRGSAGYYVLRLRAAEPERTLSVDEAQGQILTTLRAENERAWFEQNANRTLLTIHGERYTLGQFYHEYQNLPAAIREQFTGPDGMQRLADILIDRLLVLDDAYNRLLDQQNAPLLEEARTNVLRQMMHQAEMEKQPAAASEEEIKAYYDVHQDMFSWPPQARIRAIRIYSGQAEDDRQRARERAEEAFRRLTPGFGGEPADFDAVVAEYDEAEKNPADAGLGEWIRMEDDVLQNLSAHPLHEYLLGLPVDTVSQPFEFGDSIYLVKILERTDPTPMTFEQAKEYIRPELEAQRHERLDAELVDRLLREANFVAYDQVIQQMAEADLATQQPLVDQQPLTDQQPPATQQPAATQPPAADQPGHH